MKTWVKILTLLVAVETCLIAIYSCSYLTFDSNSPSVLISALGVLVTFVVAWQIWQVIDTKNVIKDLQVSFDKERAKYVVEMKAQSSKFGEYVFVSACLSDALAVMSETHYIVNNTLPSRRRIGYNWAYKVLLKSMEDALRNNVPNKKRHVEMCLDNMKSCLNNAEELKNEYEEYCIFDDDLNEKCDISYNEIINNYSNELEHYQHVKLNNLHERRQNLSQSAQR